MLNSLKTLQAKIIAFWQKLEQLAKKDLADLWNEYKGFLILIGALILIIKFRDIVISILINSSKRLFQNAENKDQKLRIQEDSNNKKADQLVEDAKNLSSEDKPVEEDWYKNEK